LISPASLTAQEKPWPDDTFKTSTPLGGEDWPQVSEPQQRTLLAIVMAQVNKLPASIR